MTRFVPFLRPAGAGAPAPGHRGVPAVLTHAAIAVALCGNRFLLDDGRLAQQALSCVIVPQPGDRVLVDHSAGECYVLHLLHRADPALAELSVPGAHALRIVQDRVALHGRAEVALHSLEKIALSAAAGLLSLEAENIYSIASESLVQSMRHYAGSAEQYLLDVSALLRMHGGHTILHAEQDVKLDGERISVG